MLRLEARNAETPIERKPPWIKTRVRTGPEYTALQHLVKSEGLHTVCQEAGCPNIFECWEDREATFLIGGDQCTRRCDFCQIDTGKPLPLDRDEPRRVAESVAAMGLRYATVTGVARDDQPDGGSWLYAQTAREIHAAVPGCGVELLVPDFNADPAQLGEVFGARPEVFAHNLETVPRIFKRIRPGFRYERSLGVLRQAHEAGLVTKSNLILGMGETREEIAPAMADLRGGRRRPADDHPVPAAVGAASPGGPLGAPGRVRRARARRPWRWGSPASCRARSVRSSYRAGKLYAQAIEQRSAAAGKLTGFLLLSPRIGCRRDAAGRSTRPFGIIGLDFDFLRLQTGGWKPYAAWCWHAIEERLSRWLTNTALRSSRTPGG